MVDFGPLGPFFEVSVRTEQELVRLGTVADQAEGPGGPAPFFSDKTQARRAEKFFLGNIMRQKSTSVIV